MQVGFICPTCFIHFFRPNETPLSVAEPRGIEECAVCCARRDDQVWQLVQQQRRQHLRYMAAQGCLSATDPVNYIIRTEERERAAQTRRARHSEATYESDEWRSDAEGRL